MKIADINIILLIILEKNGGFDRNIKLFARFMLVKERGQVHFLHISSEEQGSVLRAQARTKNLECSP